MKVCYVVSTFARNEKDIQDPWMLETIKRLKNKVNIVVFAPSFKGLKSHFWKGIFVKRFRYFLKQWEDLTHDEGMATKIKKFKYKFIFLFYFIFGWVALRRFLKKEKPDIVHIHWPFPHALWALFPKNEKIVITFHGASLYLIEKKFKIFTFLLRKIIKKSDYITTNSSYNVKKIKKFTHKKIKIIPYGPPIKEKKFQKKENKIKRILFVGRLIERKGVSYLIRSMPYVLKKIKAKLIIVGSGNEKRKLEELAKKLKIEKYVLFKGKISEKKLKEEYKKCDVFVLPSIIDSKGDTEGLGVVLIEALTYKKPIIASNVGGVPDIIKDKKTGLLVKEKNSKELARAIILILKNEELAKKLANHGYNYVKKKFNWEKIIGNILDLYKKILKNKK